MPFAYKEFYTIKDYQHWRDDWELVQGVAYAMTPSPSFSHQLISVNIVAQLKEKLEGCKHCYALMETDWEIASDTVVRPDDMVICYEPDEKIDKVPEIIFEVVSPAKARRDEQMKFELYQQEGVMQYILVYPNNKTAKVYRLENGRYVKQGDFSDGTCLLETSVCTIAFDFSLIWRR